MLERANIPLGGVGGGVIIHDRDVLHLVPSCWGLKLAFSFFLVTCRGLIYFFFICIFTNIFGF